LQTTAVVGFITNNDKTAYREVVRALGVWRQENNLSLNVNRTKEMIMDLTSYGWGAVLSSLDK
jgi:hypothetical protein